MAAGTVKLPEGFVLDTEDAAGQVKLPPGFVLDAPGKASPKMIQGPKNPSTGRPNVYSEKELAGKIMPQLTRGLYDGVPFGKNLVRLMNPEVADFQTQVPAPRGILPTIARTAGEVAPDMAMMGPFVEAAGALPAVGGLSNLAKLINNPLTRTAGGVGAYEGTKAALQGQDAGTVAKKAAAGAGGALIAGKAFEVAGKGVQKGLDTVSKAPGAVINSLVKPLLKDFSYGKNPGRAVAAEGITGNSLDELAAKIGQRRKEIGLQIRQTLIGAGNERVDLRQAFDSIDNAIAEAGKSPRTNAPLIQRLKDLKDDLLGAVVDPQTGKTAHRNLVDLTPEEALGIKVQIGDLTRFTGNPSDDQLVNSALKRAYGVIKERINQAVPAVKALNERFADLTSAEVATKYRDKIVSRQNLLSLAPKILGGGAAIAGLVTGDPRLIGAAIIEIGAERILASPALKTRVAASLAKLPAEELAKVLESQPALKKLPKIAAKAAGAITGKQ